MQAKLRKFHQVSFFTENPEETVTGSSFREINYSPSTLWCLCCPASEGRLEGCPSTTLLRQRFDLQNSGSQHSRLLQICTSFTNLYLFPAEGTVPGTSEEVQQFKRGFFQPFHFSTPILKGNAKWSRGEYPNHNRKQILWTHYCWEPQKTVSLTEGEGTQSNY